jgi:glycosyltransferase involved in cell wall biosynthesis
MACGTTVVASDLPVVRELLAEGENARLVKAERPAELARAIRILLDYPEENAKLAGKAREKVAAQYSWTLQKERLQQLYQLLTNNHKRHVQKLKKSLPDAP